MSWFGFVTIASVVKNMLFTIFTKFSWESVRLSVALKFNVYLNLEQEGPEQEN